VRLVPVALLALAITGMADAPTVFVLADAIVDTSCAALPAGPTIGLTLFVVLSWVSTTAFLRRARRLSVGAFAALGILLFGGGTTMVAVAGLGLARRGSTLAAGLEGYGALFWAIPAGMLAWGVILIAIAVAGSRRPLPAAAAPAPPRRGRRQALAIVGILVGLGAIGAMTSTPTADTPPSAASLPAGCRG